MTVRYVECDKCQAIENFTEMVFCPVCRESMCKRCAVDGLQKAGHCGKRLTCVGQTPHEKSEGFEEPKEQPPSPEPKKGFLKRLFGG